MSVTLEKAQEMLDGYLTAEANILKSQEYAVADRSTRRAMLDQVIAGRREWEGKVDALTNACGGAPRVTTIIPHG